ncbi:DUF2927 domain-containing protein [Yoonia sp. 2307UL14-13]|uniref:DUF2927 domain-containing protein n=1 Tax=Yoonia sp. 2307UL14-13 TaxID=3126506 RepID=UPI0030B4DDCA
MKQPRQHILRVALIGATLLLAGCDDLFQTVPPPAPPEPPVVAPPTEPVVVPPSETSRALAVYYRRLQSDLLTQGLLRGDGGGPDTPFTAAQLGRNFVRIALFNEYRDDSDFRSPQATVSRLRRWEQPIRMSVEFGPSVPLEQRAMDETSVASYAARLSRLTGVRITQTDQSPNYYVLFWNEDDRRASVDRLREIIPGISDTSLRAILNLPRDQLCLVVGTFAPGGAQYQQAVAIIRAEHPNLMRAACIHEELAQGMGLANDSPQARPSIFNDDEEFGLLTTHDELLLRMLYNPALQTGMRPNEAAPIARRLARQILAEGAS